MPQMKIYIYKYTVMWIRKNTLLNSMFLRIKRDIIKNPLVFGRSLVNTTSDGKQHMTYYTVSLFI